MGSACAAHGQREWGILLLLKAELGAVQYAGSPSSLTWELIEAERRRGAEWLGEKG